MNLSDLEKVNALQKRADSMNDVLNAIDKGSEFTITIPNPQNKETVYSIVLTPEFYTRVRNEIVTAYRAKLQEITEQLEDLGVNVA